MAESPHLIFRVSSDVKDRVRELAALHGRDISEEMRMAWALFDTQATFAWLHTEEGVAAMGVEHGETVKAVKSDLEALTARAFPHPRGPLLDLDKSNSDGRMN